VDRIRQHDHRPQTLRPALLAPVSVSVAGGLRRIIGGRPSGMYDARNEMSQSQRRAVDLIRAEERDSGEYDAEIHRGDEEVHPEGVPPVGLDEDLEPP